MSTGEHRDGLPAGPHVRGRGAGLNPGNRFEDVRLHVLGEHLDEVVAENPDGTTVKTTVYRDATREVVNRVTSPDVGMLWTVNPYRGCEHGCIYCYARPTHEYLGMSCGLDFETRIAAKFDAPRLLRETLLKPSWKGEPISMSGVTDPYQPLESKLRITRGCMEVFAELAHPLWLITKNRLILRDLDLMQELARHHAVHAAVSITSLDNRLAAKMEPRASSPRERLDAVRRMTDAGVPVTVMVAPVVPSLNEPEIAQLLKAAADAGAVNAAYVLLRLPYQIKDLFLDWLSRQFPERAAKVEAAIRETRDGGLNDAAAFTRFRGEGVRADHIRDTFRMFQRRFGLDRSTAPCSSAEFLKRRERALSGGQMGLFG